MAKKEKKEKKPRKPTYQVEEERDRKMPSYEWRAIKNRKLVYTVYFVLRLLVIVMMVLQFFNKNYENVAMCVLVLILFMLPSIIERRMHIDLPDTLEIIILLFIFAAEILGEIQSFYLYFPNWDTVLHTLNGFLCAAIGFSLVDLLNREERIFLHLSPFYMAVVAFCFSMTIGVLWEFGEFTMDRLFLMDTQKDTIVNLISTVELDPTKSNTTTVIRGITDTILVLEDGTQVSLGLGGYLDIGLIDTMEDLFVNFVGAVVFSVIGYFWIKNRGTGTFARQFIPTRQRTPAEQEALPAGETPEAEAAAEEEQDAAKTR